MLRTIFGTALALSVVAPSSAVSATTTSTITKALTSTGPISAVWANTGEDKVTRNELRGSRGTKSLINSAWDGTQITLFGAKNEVVAFNLVLEAANTSASSVSVKFNSLRHADGTFIQSTPAAVSVFNWTNRDIELFYVRYLPVKGLSRLSYGTYDERHIPEKLRRPQRSDGSYKGGWTARPNHDKAYPDIAVPIEKVPQFSIGLAKNQSIWADIYVPKTASAGTYTGEVTVSIAGSIVYRVPVQLVVRNFALPDIPTAKTMAATSYNDIARRYTGVEYPGAGSSQDQLTKLVMDRQMLMAHRHKLSLIDDNGGATSWTQDAPRPEWIPRLNGSLFTAARGYRGPGESVGNNVFSIGTYGAWQDWWGAPTSSSFVKHTNGWESWFQQNSPATERFLYLIDESTDYEQTEQWASWIKNNTGIGGQLRSFATADLTSAQQEMPSLSMSASWIAVADTPLWSAAFAARKATGHAVYFYNGQRPASGSFAIEDEGVALRELVWGQYKLGIDRWFFWNVSYYNDYQGGRGDTNVFTNAQTFGGPPYADAILGMTSWNYSNGDGVLFYPGTDKKFPGQSYGLDGPIASLRLKFWRRGIQDADYLALAAKIDPVSVQSIVASMVPRVMWEVGVDDPADPSWKLTPISWDTNPDAWEAARRRLADIIEGG